jgi:hypothetical protein
VTLGAVSSLPVSVALLDEQQDGDGASADYSAATGTLNFAAGVTTQTIRSADPEDTLNEAKRDFHGQPGEPRRMRRSRRDGIGTITDNDVRRRLSINDDAQ